jgi:DNA-binding MarR family transcriptional regulator
LQVQQRAAAFSEEEKLEALLARWLRAVQFRRKVERALRRKGLTFAQWRVLHAAQRLVLETNDAVSQRKIQQRTQSDANTISAVVKRLTAKGLVDWDLNDRDWSYRILVTEKGATLLEAASRLVLSVALAA